VLERHEGRELRAALAHDGGRALEDGGALLPTEALPRRLRGLRGAHGGVDVRGGAAGERREDLARGRVARLERLLGRDLLPADEHRVPLAHARAELRERGLVLAVQLRGLARLRHAEDSVLVLEGGGHVFPIGAAFLKATPISGKATLPGRSSW